MLNKAITCVLLVGSLFSGSQQSVATIVVQDNTMADGGLHLNATEFFESGEAWTSSGTALSDGNQFAIFNQAGNNSFTGFAHHLPIADVTSAQPLIDGMTLRVSVWLASDPNKPWNTLVPDGLKIDFYNVPLSGYASIGMTNDTESGFGLGLIPMTQSLSTTAWTQKSFTVPITDALVDFSSLAEIRPVLFEGDFSGASPGANGGRLFLDGLVVEVFPDLATANTTPLPSNQPGGFDLIIPEPVSASLLAFACTTLLSSRQRN